MALFIDKHAFAYNVFLSLYKYMRAYTNFPKMYGKGACIHDIVSLNEKLSLHQFWDLEK